MNKKLLLCFLLVQTLFLGTLRAALAGLSINGQTIPAGKITVRKGSWTFRSQWKLNDPAKSPEELQLLKGNWKKHAEYAHMVGYNGDIILQISAAEYIEQLHASCKISNYADSRQRDVRISYSLDGRNYKILSDSKFKAGSKILDGQTALPKETKQLRIRFSRILDENDSNGRYGFVLFNQISLELKGKTATGAAAQSASAASQNTFRRNSRDFTVNGSVLPPQALSFQNQNWTLSRSWELNNPAKSPAELQLQKGHWKKHTEYAHMVGYNGDILLKIRYSGKIEKLQASATITNFADSRQRKFSITYSTDGLKYLPLAEGDFKAGKKHISGKTTALSSATSFLWLKYSRTLTKNDSNGKYGFVLFNQLGLTIEGKLSSEKKNEGKSLSLKQSFPTGVFWAWERTRVNAEKAGMEFWQFVDAQMKQLREYGCDTLWFVNLGPKFIPKVLMLAEKHQLKALINPDLLSIFYQGAVSLNQLDQLARQTAEKYADFPALKGYILKDEPELCSLETLDYFARLLKKYDPIHDCTAVVMNRPSMNYLRESELPVICTDIYYFGHDRSLNIPNPSSVSQQQFTMGLNGYNTQAELHNKHHWFMGQIYSEFWGRHYVKNGRMIVYPKSYLHWRMPTPAETRWQIWEAVRNGSKGVFFFVLFPTKQLEIPPEQVKADSPDRKLVDKMDRRSRTASRWPQQWLTEKIMEFDAAEAIVQYGGAPTPQMKAMGESFRFLRKHEAFLSSKRRAKFPVFFSSDAQTDTATFENGDDFRYGIIVNRNVNRNRTVSVLLPANIRSVKDIRNGKTLTILPKNENFREIRLDLPAGDGTILQAAFVNDIPGMCICRENFDQITIHRVRLHDNSEIFHYGEYGVDARRAIRLKKNGDSSKPIFSVENITNFNSPVNTFALNLNCQKKAGVMYCQITGRPKSAVIRAISDQSSAGNETNVSHLAQENFRKCELNSTGMRGLIIQTGDSRVPAVIPVGTTSLEVRLANPADYIDDLILWFVPQM